MRAYEEDNFTRLQLNKQQKKEARRRRAAAESFTDELQVCERTT